MTHRLALAASGSALAFALILASCSERKESDGSTSDIEIVTNAAGDQTDPALTSALEDQIMVDPALAQQRNGTAARPGAAPAQAPIPATPPFGTAESEAGMMRAPAPTQSQAPTGLTLGELAKSQAGGRATPDANCYRSLQYSVGWAQRLPANLPLHSDAQVSEAAGSAVPGCNVRVVSYVSGAPIGRLIDFYYTHARRAGFSAEHQASGADHILAGDKGDAAYLVTVRANPGGGTEVDLLANHGR